MRITLDVEASGLLDETTIDYTSSPYKLKDSFKMWCIVCIDVDTDTVYRFVQEDIKTKFRDWAKNVTTLIAHNGIDYDLLAIKLYLGMDYSIGDTVNDPDSWDGRPIEIIDTLVWSKCLNPDRFGGHSLDEWGHRVGFNKIDWRAEAVDLGLISYGAPKGAEFNQFHPQMVEYCVRDNQVTVLTYKKLLEEIGTWPWSDALWLEKAVAEIITRQKHRGFSFDKEAAEANVRELDLLMQSLKEKVEPVLPEKFLTKTKLKDYTAPARQFLKSGEIAGDLIKFITKHSGTLDKEARQVVLYGKTYDLPLDREKPLFLTEPATLKDTTHIKEWLVSLGWTPSQYKEKDLTCDSKKKKLTEEKFVATVERYVIQTLNSNFCKDRCEHLKVQPNKLKEKLLKHDLTKPLKVLTNPTFTVGQDKEIDPLLEKLKETFPYAEDIVHFLTYQHRRNSILGGGFDPDEDDEDDFEKGYLANARQDGRISTPADSCGCGTSRFKHRVVANIPRVTSLYGEKMRGMFGVSPDFIQFGYDFDSLEARIEAHYCYRYDLTETKEYCTSLIMEKPRDVHSITALKISKIIAKDFSRGNAKSVKYGSSYGAQAPKVAKIVGCDLQTAQQIFDAFWEAAKPLALLKENLTKYWETTGCRSFILGIDKRRIPTRSKHALVNSLFQSAGVINAKRAMVLHDRKLKAENLIVDFFKDDFKHMAFCQQMIAYHDESQLELSKHLVKIKTFNIEQKPTQEAQKEESARAKALANAYKKQQEESTGKIYSDVGHTDKCYYVGYCRAGELAVQAVTEAGRYYNLNVDLTAGYMLGRNWAQCH